MAVLVRVFGDIDAAEDAVQDAFAVALERWQLVDDLHLDGYYLLHGIRAELLSRLGRTAAAAAEYDAAIARTDSAAQHRFLTARRAALAT